MKILVFDTETTGLPTKRDSPLIYTHNWPYIVQLSYMLYDLDKHTFEYADNIIRLKSGVTISPDSMAIHGITHTICREHGRDIQDVLNEFNNMLLKADLLLGHNILFDKNVIIVEHIRNKLTHNFRVNNINIPHFCTMENSTARCNIVRYNRYGKAYQKYPKLVELHQHLFDESPSGLHNALVDIVVCLRCYLKMQHNIDVYEHSVELVKLRDTCPTSN